ncbi:MAG: hypothetical protein ABSA39_11990 [Edaphobacter sp.]
MRPILHCSCFSCLFLLTAVASALLYLSSFRAAGGPAFAFFAFAFAFAFALPFAFAVVCSCCHSERSEEPPYLHLHLHLHLLLLLLLPLLLWFCFCRHSERSEEPLYLPFAVLLPFLTCHPSAQRKNQSNYFLRFQPKNRMSSPKTT